jgi:copper chaperone CopZ
MTNTYTITGMTCSGCAAKVEYLLSKVPGVSSVKVDLEKKSANITTEQPLDNTNLTAALSGTKYSIAEQQAISAPLSPEVQASTFKTYLPIFLIFSYITATTLLIQYVSGSFNCMQWMSHFMAGFFLVFSFFKMLDISAFAMSYSSYDIVAKRWQGYGYIYPFIELLLGISFLIPSLLKLSNWATLVVMSISIIGVLQSVLNKRKIQCACLGAVFNLPMSTITIIEDGLMIVMSAVTLFLIK